MNGSGEKRGPWLSVPTAHGRKLSAKRQGVPDCLAGHGYSKYDFAWGGNSGLDLHSGEELRGTNRLTAS